MSLRWRLAIGVGLIVAVVVAAGAFAAQFAAERELRGEVDSFLVERIDVISRQPDSVDRGRGQGRRAPRLRDPLVTADAVTQIVGPDGTVYGPFDDNDVELPVTDVDVQVGATPGASVIRTVDIDGVDYRMITASIRSGFSVQVARDLTETNSALAGLRNRLIVFGVIGTAVAVGVGWLVARRLTQPVERLTAAAEHVAATQELTAPIEVGRTDEVGRLAESFNTMLAALDSSREQQHRLVMDASHELRTPLTSLRTNIEVLQRAADDMEPEARQRLLHDVNLELIELTTLVAELVELATDSRASENAVEVHLRDLVDRVADLARRRHDRQIHVTSTNGHPVMARPAMLERAVSNLVDNAVKFSPPGSAIEVSIDGSRVAVRDHGPGIPPDDLPHVFDRFYRSTSARTLAGSGLGLSIVKHVIDSHDGEVFAAAADGGGAVVGFELPETQPLR